MKTATPTMIIAAATALLLTGCATPEPTAKERLEEQGIVYSQEDWDTTVNRICVSDYPDVYMGVSDALERNKDTMTRRQQLDAVLSAGKGYGPGAADMSDRERWMVIDLVQEENCPKE